MNLQADMAVGGLSAIRIRVGEVRHLLAIEENREPIPLHANFVVVPLACRLRGLERKRLIILVVDRARAELVCTVWLADAELIDLDLVP